MAVPRFVVLYVVRGGGIAPGRYPMPMSTRSFGVFPIGAMVEP